MNRVPGSNCFTVRALLPSTRFCRAIIFFFSKREATSSLSINLENLQAITHDLAVLLGISLPEYPRTALLAAVRLAR